MIGKTIGPYQVVAKLGEGGMGEVYRARDTRLGRDVAIKITPPALATEPERLSRFEREARALAALNHPNVGAIYGLEESDGQRFLVLELVEGETLADRLVRIGAPPLQETLAVARQIAAALEAAHAKNLVHRDLKPGNVMITPSGAIKVLDFGLAKSVASPFGGRAESTLETMSAPTQLGRLLGTPAYMSPEQARGETVDQRSDVWAFGCLLYELLSGRRPFSGGSVPEVLSRVLEREPDWTGLPRRTPTAIVGLVQRCLRKDRTGRPDIGEIRRVLESASARGLGRVGRLAVAAAAVLVVGLVVGLPLTYQFRRGSDDAIRTLAVLPFVDASSPQASEYLVDGLTESLIRDLSRAENLRVLPHSAVARFAGSDPADARAAAEQLGVDAVLVGRLRQQAQDVSVHAELVRASDGSLWWADEFRQAGTNVLDIQRRLTEALAGQLALTFAPDHPVPAPVASTADPDAFRLYLQGRYYWNTRTEENLRRSQAAFEEAIARDPSYARAWAGLADAFLMLGAWSVVPPADAYPRARTAAERAITLDDSLAEPHATLGYLKTLFEWDWSDADREFRRAIELDPRYATAHHWYAYYFQTIGDAQRSIAEIERARDLDPLSPVINSEVAWFYAQARQFDRALEEARRMVDMGLSYHSTSIQVLRLRAFSGDPDVSASDVAFPSPDAGPLALSDHVVLLAQLGDRARAQAVLTRLEAQARQRYVMPAALAQGYAAVGDLDRALDFFERSVDDRSLVASWLRAPELDGLRSRARFRALFERLGLQP